MTSKTRSSSSTQAEAETVRMIFARYLALKSFQKLVDELNEKGVLSKKRQVASKTLGGIPFAYGPLAYLLKNRTYLGQTHYKDQWFSGEHEAIIPHGIFEQVQQLLKANTSVEPDGAMRMAPSSPDFCLTTAAIV